MQCVAGAGFPFIVQTQGTWLLWARGGQPGNRLFQPFLKEENEAEVITPMRSFNTVASFCSINSIVTRMARVSTQGASAWIYICCRSTLDH